MRTESDGIAAALKSCGEQLGKAERQLDELKGELHQLQECRKSWEPYINQLLHDEGVRLSAAIHLLNCERYAACIQVMRTGSNTVELGTRTCHIHFDDKTRVENEIEQLALQVHGS